MDLAPPLRDLRKHVAVPAPDDVGLAEPVIEQIAPARGEIAQVAIEHRDGNT